jgi:Flp pilus assembly pilin Flp
MRGHVKELQQWLGAWFASRRQVTVRDDRGAISTEMAIITALVGVAAVALATFIATNITSWQADIPTP